MKAEKTKVTNGSKFAIRTGPIVGFTGVKVDSNNRGSRLESGIRDTSPTTGVP